MKTVRHHTISTVLLWLHCWLSQLCSAMVLLWLHAFVICVTFCREAPLRPILALWWLALEMWAVLCWAFGMCGAEREDWWYIKAFKEPIATDPWNHLVYIWLQCFVFIVTSFLSLLPLPLNSHINSFASHGTHIGTSVLRTLLWYQHLKCMYKWSNTFALNRISWISLKYHAIVYNQITGVHIRLC